MNFSEVEIGDATPAILVCVILFGKIIYIGDTTPAILVCVILFDKIIYNW